MNNNRSSLSLLSAQWIITLPKFCTEMQPAAPTCKGEDLGRPHIYNDSTWNLRIWNALLFQLQIKKVKGSRPPLGLAIGQAPQERTRPLDMIVGISDCRNYPVVPQSPGFGASGKYVAGYRQ
jgi:hypothetical protein